MELGARLEDEMRGEERGSQSVMGHESNHNLLNICVKLSNV